jgi:hypothetical protein
MFCFFGPAFEGEKAFGDGRYFWVGVSSCPGDNMEKNLRLVQYFLELKTTFNSPGLFQ